MHTEAKSTAKGETIPNKMDHSVMVTTGLPIIFHHTLLPPPEEKNSFIFSSVMLDNMSQHSTTYKTTTHGVPSSKPMRQASTWTNFLVIRNLIVRHTTQQTEQGESHSQCLSGASIQQKMRVLMSLHHKYKCDTVIVHV